MISNLCPALPWVGGGERGGQGVVVGYALWLDFFALTFSPLIYVCLLLAGGEIDGMGCGRGEGLGHKCAPCKQAQKKGSGSCPKRCPACSSPVKEWVFYEVDGFMKKKFLVTAAMTTWVPLLVASPRNEWWS